MTPQTHKKLKRLRKQIDRIDQKLVRVLAKRFKIVKEMGHLKRKNEIPILQKSRWRQILKSRAKLARQNKLNAPIVLKIFELIHKEALQIQLRIGKLRK